MRHMKTRILREMDEESIFTDASPGKVPVDPADMQAIQADPTVQESKIRRAVRRALGEDIGKVWMDYGQYGSDTDGPSDHDVASWSPIDDVEDDPDESLSPAYVSRKRSDESRRRAKSQGISEYYAGPPRAASGIRKMPEYQQFLDFVIQREISGIHPDDVLRRWRSMFPDVRLASSQIAQLHAALEAAGVLDVRANESKLPFKQARLSESKLIRRFSSDASDQELVWHRDRQSRSVRVVEGKGWSLQLDNQLPKPLTLGETHNIPAGQWHRIIRHDNATNLCVIIQELKKGDRVKHKGKKATVKVPDARGPLVGIDPDGPQDMKMVPDDEVKSVKEAKKKGLWANVHAKRKRGKRPAKPGDKNYPDEKSLKAAQGK